MGEKGKGREGKGGERRRKGSYRVVFPQQHEGIAINNRNEVTRQSEETRFKTNDTDRRIRIADGSCN